MDALWYGLATFFEWIFSLIVPIGRLANIFFIAAGAIGTVYWLWYGEVTRKGIKRNYMADPGGKAKP